MTAPLFFQQNKRGIKHTCGASPYEGLSSECHSYDQGYRIMKSCLGEGWAKKASVRAKHTEVGKQKSGSDSQKNEN